MRVLRCFLVLMAAGYASACATTPPEVPAPRRMADLSRMKGEWVGDYYSTACPGEGLLLMRLDADADSAWGTAWMTMRDWGQLYFVRPEDLPGTGLAEPLAIRFVPDNGGFVSGRLEVYFDPELGCPLTTTFRGHFEMNALEGTFISEDPETGEWSAGTWRLERSKRSRAVGLIARAEHY